MVLKNTTVDDRDMTVIKYQGIWFNVGTYNATSVGKTGTLSTSNDLNAGFTIDTPSIVAFYYFGIKRGKGGFYQICIDCDPNNRQWQDIDGVNTTDNGQNPPVALFSKTWADSQPHEIMVSNRPDTRYPDNNSQITLDKIIFSIDDNAPQPPSTVTQISLSAAAGRASSSSIGGSIPTLPSITLPSMSSPSGATASQALPNIINGSLEAPLLSATPVSPSVTPGPGQASSSPSKSNGTIIAAAVSSAVGGILVLLLIIFFVLRGGKKRMSRQAAAVPTSTNVLLQYPGPTASESKPSSSSDPSSKRRTDPSTTQTSSYTSQNRIPRREEDAGSVHGMSEYADGSVLPPNYQDATRNRMVTIPSESEPGAEDLRRGGG